MLTRLGGDVRFECNDCETVFNCDRALKRHKKDNCQKGHQEASVCDLCGFTTKSRAQFWQHKAKHSESYKLNSHNRKFNCLQCDKVFDRTKLLTQHYMTDHHGVMPFMCESCPKSFAKYAL